jgi:2-succinyl-5-enolpyruvyl-6-hydroxy-3-cyclohexene-1-carboxylate synthase
LTRAIGAWLAHAGEIVIDAHGRWWDPGHRMRELVAADPVDTLTRIATSIGVDTGSAWGDAWREADAAVVSALDHLLASGGGLDGARTVRAAVAAAPAGAHVVVASSLAVRHLDRHGPVRSDVTWHANRGVAGIDGTVSTAHGVALAAQAPVIAVLGDVALLHDTNGWLLDAGDEEPDLVVVALDDDGGGIFDLLPPGDYPAQRRLFATPHGRDLTRLATLHGVTAHTAAPEDVAKVVEAACARGGRHLVVVDVAPPDPAVAQTVREVVARTLSVLGDVARAP